MIGAVGFAAAKRNPPRNFTTETMTAFAALNPSYGWSRRMQWLNRLAMAVLVVAVFATTAAAQPVSDATIPAKASDQIVADLARVDLDAFAKNALRYMPSSQSERLKNNFAAIKDLGPSQYSELVYFRDYGQTGKDIIYKIDYDKAFTYVRLLWHIDSGGWRLIHIAYKTENNLPFPAGWEHIYPK